MTAQPIIANERINLSTAEILLADDPPESLDVLSQMFQGFGARALHRCPTAEKAMAVVAQRDIDLMVVGSSLPDMDGYAFVQWLRRSEFAPNRFAPVILLTGHTRPAEVYKGRDAGANFVIRRPVSPLVMMQRIMWISREARPFVEAPGYCGPDRRFRALGPPVGEKGRRKDDLSAEVGAATTPNMDQGAIDAMFQPRRAAR